MSAVYRSEQIDTISGRLNLSKSDVNLILSNYNCYLEEKIRSGNTVKVLNVCYIRNLNEKNFSSRETLAYVATEIADATSMGSVTVLRVLTTLDELIAEDVKNGNDYYIRGLINIRCIKGENGEKKLRVRKSSKYCGEPAVAIVTSSFKRRVGV